MKLRDGYVFWELPTQDGLRCPGVEFIMTNEKFQLGFYDKVKMFDYNPQIWVKIRYPRPGDLNLELRIEYGEKDNGILKVYRKKIK